jgi:hypothetical protein
MVFLTREDLRDVLNRRARGRHQTIVEPQNVVQFREHDEIGRGPRRENGRN